MKKKILTIILVVYAVVGIAQSNNDLFYYFKNLPQSPSTATFLRYGEIQNSEFTGTNTPKIPLYTVEEGNIILNLTLDYLSGNGVKVSDEATSTGMGWNIGLPVIVQSVLVEDDFDFNLTIEKLKIDLHHQNAPWPMLDYTGKYLESKEGWQPSGYIETPQIGKYTYQYSINHTLPVKGLFQGYPNWLRYDTSPDIFTLNLFGEKLDFFIANHKDLKNNSVIPQFINLKKGYNITFNINSLTFIITAPTGITYTFGGVEEVKVNSNIINRNYLLTSIKDKNNKKITIEYNQYTNIKNFIPNSKNLNYNKGVTDNYAYCEGVPLYYTTGYVSSTKLNGVSGQSAPFFEVQATGTYHIPTSPFFLTVQNYLQVSKIHGEFGSLNFTYTGREDFPTSKLSNISLKNNINVEVKKIDFDYSYSIADNTSLKNAPSDLFDDNRMQKRLFLKKLTINQNENYTFNYKNENSLPRKDSYAVDYWGYYNSGTNNKTYFLNPLDLNGSILPLSGQNNNKKVSDINYTTAGILDRINYPTQGSSIFTYESNSADNLFSNYNPSPIKQGKGVRLKNQTNYDSQGSFVEKTQFMYENGYSTNPLDLITEYNTRFIQANNNHIFGTEVISMNSTNNYSTSPLSSGDIVGYQKVTKVQVDTSGNEKGKIISDYSINPDAFYHFFPNQVSVPIPRTKSEGIENGMLLSQEYKDNSNQTIKKVVNEYNMRYSDIYQGTMFTPINEYLFVCGGFGIPTADSGSKLLSVVSHFPIFSKESLLSKTTITEFLGDKQIVNKTDYQYDSNNFLTQKSQLLSSQEQMTESYLYTSQIPRFQQANILSESIGKNTYKNGKQIFGTKINYDNGSNYNPSSITKYDILDNINFIESRYEMYDQDRLLQFKVKEGIPITIIWGYNKTLPIAKIEGANYSQIMLAYGLNPGDPTSYQQLDIVKKSNIDFDDTSENLLISKLNDFRNKPELADFKITTYTHDPLIGVKSVTQSTGINEFYKYDTSNRLEKILNNQNSIVKEFKYNYSPLKYYNSQRSGYFTRNNCGTSGIGGTYKYIVPANQYTSTISENDANQMAQNDVDSNGQNVANATATCTPISCSVIKGSGLVTLHYGSIGISPNQNNMYRIQMGFPLDSGLPWKTTGVIIGRITGSCIPSALTGSSCYYQGIWSLKISPNGDILARKIDGSDNFGTTMSLDFTLLMN